MEKRQRIIFYGRSVILGTVSASLQKDPQFEIICLSIPYPGLQDLREIQPDVIVFDLVAGRPEPAFALLAAFPHVQLIGINPDSNQILAWSGQQLHELSMLDLIGILHKGGTETRAAKTKA